MNYNNFEKLKFNIKELLGSGVGVAHPFIKSGLENYSNIKMKIQQVSLPNYHNVMFNSLRNESVSYHISGYGSSHKEAITRTMGEAIERYSFMSSYHLIKNKIKVESYKNLIDNGYNTLPLRFLNITPISNDYFVHVNENDELEWVELFNYVKHENIYIPIQFICSDRTEKKLGIPTMSTGTATHVSYENALLNAMIEAFQINCFMKAWYLKQPLKQIEWKGFVSTEFMDLYNSMFGDMTDTDIKVLHNPLEETCFNNFITVISNKKVGFPLYAVGVQGGINSEYAMWRSIMEAVSIYINLESFYIFMDREIDSVDHDKCRNSLNLDDTFYFWANGKDINKKVDFMNSLISNEKIEFNKINKMSKIEKMDELKEMFSIVRKKLKYAMFLDITPPELYEYGYKTVRFIAPELLSMNLPVVPYTNHPCFDEIGGIKGDVFPHPLP